MTILTSLGFLFSTPRGPSFEGLSALASPPPYLGRSKLINQQISLSSPLAAWLRSKK
jgi:hypothetical protein